MSRILFLILVLLFIKLFIYNNRAWNELCDECDSNKKSKKVNNECICDVNDYRIYEPTGKCECLDRFYDGNNITCESCH